MPEWTGVDRVTPDDLELVDPASIEPHPDNPRVHDDATIRRSITDHGVIDVCVVQRSRRRILGGHGRWENAVAEGATRLPVLWVDCDDDEAEEILLVLNRTADNASYDNSGLAAILSRIKDAGRDVERTGWDGSSLRRFIARTHAEERQARDAEQVDPPIPTDPVPRCAAGDMWALGAHRLMCGDCRNADDVARLLDGAEINVAFTSPPYAEQRKYDETTEFRPIPPDEYVEWFAPVAANVATHLTDDGSWFVNIKPTADGLDTHLYVIDLVGAHAREWGWHFATEFCWERNGVPKNVTMRFKNQFEPVYQFARARWKIRPHAVGTLSDLVPMAAGPGVGDTAWHDAQGNRRPIFGGGMVRERRNGTSDLMSDAQGTNVAPGEYIAPGVALPGNRLPTFSGTHEAVGHAAAFPVGLPQWFVRAFSDEGDTVYDPFVGSGSTILAAENEHRIGFGMEISPRYCDMTIARWEALTGRTAERVAVSADA